MTIGRGELEYRKKARKHMAELKSKKEQAEERNANWAKLTPQQQLDDLDRRLGKGVGAKKQRARIAKKLEK